MVNTYRILLLFLILILPNAIFCQIEGERCFTLDNLISLVNQHSYNEDSSAIRLIRDKGFQWSSDTISYEYIDKNITLHYQSSNVFYDNINWSRPSIIIFASNDGLCNIVKMRLNKSLCPYSMRSEFDNNNFHPSNGGQQYHGHSMLNDKPNYYEIDYYEDSTDIEMIIKNKGELDEYTQKLAKNMETMIYAKIERANKLCSDNKFNDAYSTIDSAMGLYSPMDSSLYIVRKKIRNNHIKFLYGKLSEAVNKTDNISEGISLCNEILVLDNQNDSINEIRRMLIGTTKKEYQPYSQQNPLGYNMVLSSLEDIINNEILNNHSIQKQSMKLEFTFQTDLNNKSSGSMSLKMFEADGFTQIDSTKLAVRNRRLNTYVNSIATSPLISPIKKYGLMVNTNEKLSYTIEWESQDKIVKMIRGKKISSNNTLKPYIDSINAEYLKNISPKTKKDTLPYKVIYTVTQWDKRCNGNSATDIRITGIKTSNYYSWMPSLAIPGLGTYLQGYHSSVIARALPFAMFTTISILGLKWENGKGKEIERPGWKDEKGSTSRFWEYKNFGYIAGYISLAVAATIYINDLTESIIATNRNLKRTQRLRDAFEKNNYLNLQTQDIELEKTK